MDNEDFSEWDSTLLDGDDELDEYEPSESLLNGDFVMKQPNGNMKRNVVKNKRCIKCPILYRCTPDIAATCVRVYHIGFKIGYRLSKNKKNEN